MKHAAGQRGSNTVALMATLAAAFSPAALMAKAAKSMPKPRDQWRSPKGWVKGLRQGFYRMSHPGSRSKYTRHQGIQERARRVRQMANGRDCGQFN